MDYRRESYPKRPCYSAPNTTNNSPELTRKSDFTLRNIPPRASAGFTRVAVAEVEDVAAHTAPCDVRAECFLFLVMTSLTVLTMVAAMTVLVLQFASGGKIFVKNREAGKNYSAEYRPPFNYRN